MKKYIKYFLLIFWVLGIILYVQAKGNVQFAEWYATTIYPPISKGINVVMSFIPFSLGEFIIILGVIGVIVYIITNIVFIIKKKDQRGMVVLNFIVNPILLAGVLFFLYMTNSGVNAYRQTFADTAGFVTKQGTTQELTNLCYILAEQANQQRLNVDADEYNVAVFAQNETIDDIEKYSKDSYDTIGELYPTLTKGYGETKSLLSSSVFSSTQLTGFFFPYTFEANVNTAIPDYTIPFTMCHELSHLRGYMKEDEANFLAYLVCQNSYDSMTQYSGTFTAFIHATNALSGQDTAAYQQVLSTLDTGVQNDITANDKYWSSYKGVMADTAQSVNDTYLKAIDQTNGVESHGKMVDLLLAYYSDYV